MMTSRVYVETPANMPARPVSAPLELIPPSSLLRFQPLTSTRAKSKRQLGHIIHNTGPAIIASTPVRRHERPPSPCRRDCMRSSRPALDRAEATDTLVCNRYASLCLLAAVMSSRYLHGRYPWYTTPGSWGRAGNRAIRLGSHDCLH